MACFVSLLGLLAAGHPAAAQTYTWNWVTGTSSTFTDPGWDTTPPNLGSPSAALVLNYAGGLPGGTSYTLTNNLGSPQFDLNALTFNTYSSTNSGGFTFASAAGHSLRFNGADAVINQDGLGLVTLSSAITLNAGAVVRVGSTSPAFGLGDITLSGVISGAGGLVIGNGASGNAPTQNTRVVRLTGANTFTGGVTLDGGNLSISGSTALGASGTFTVTANGGTLGGSATGLGVTSWVLNGALQWNGSIQLSSNTLVSGAGDLFVRGFGTIQSASAAYTGTVTTAGTLTLSGSFGALTGVNTFNVVAGGTLALSSNVAGSTPNADRIADTATVNLSGGNLTLTGAVTATALTERVGVLTGTGYNTVNFVDGSGGREPVLHAAALTRVDRGTFLFRGFTLGSTGAITFTTAPVGDLIGGGGPAGSPTVSILPYAIGDPTTSTPGTNLVTLDSAANGGVAGTVGVRPLTSAEYVGNLTSGPTTNAYLGSTVVNAGTATINALVLGSVGGVTVAGPGTLNITSGVILKAWSGAGQISNHVAFGAAEGQIFTSDALTIGGNLTGSNGLTKSGDRALILTGNNTGLTGRLTLNDGQVSFNTLNALPGTGAIVARGNGWFNPQFDILGTALRYTGNTPATLDRDVAVGSDLLTLDSANPTAPLTLSGVVSGAGGLRIGITSASVVALTGANTYTGPTRVYQGVLVITSDANLGVGGGLDLYTEARSFDTSREGIRLAGDWTTARPVNFSESSFVDTQGHTAVWDGVVTGISFSRLIKAGSGLLQLNAASPYPGGVIVNAGGGEVRLARNGALLSPTYTLDAGTTLHLDNTVLPAGSGAGPVTTNRVNDAAVVNLASATLRFTGNGTQGTIERVGNVIVTGSGGVIEALSSGGQTNSLFINNLSTAAGSPVLVRGTGLGGTGGSHGRLFLAQINGLAVSNGLFLGGVTAEDLNAPGVIDFAVYDTTVGVRRVNTATDFTSGPAIQNAAPTSLPATANFRVNPMVASPVPVLDAANTVGSLRFAPNAVVDYAGGVASTLTVTSGVIATEAGGAATVTNTGPGRLTLTAGARPLFITAPSDLTLNAALGGSGGVVKYGAGTLTLNAASTNTGPLTVNAGGVTLGANLTVGGLTGVAGTAIDLGSNTLTVNAASFYSSHAGVITGTGSLSVATNLILAGNNTFSGGAISVGGAGFTLDHPNGLGSGPVTFTGLGGSVTFNTGTVTFANDITLSAPTSTAIFYFGIPSGSDQTLTLTGLIRGGSSPSYFRPFSSSSNGIVLANPNNTFTGIIDMQYGFLAVSRNSALGNPANPINLGVLRFDADFTGGNVLARNLSIGYSTGTLNTNGYTVEVSGVLSNSSTLVKTGAGTLILSNAANTHTGWVTVNAGTLRVNGNMAGAATPPVVTVNSGGTLGGTGTLGATGATRNVTIAPGGTLAPGGASSIGTLSVNGSTTLTAAAPGTGAVFAVRAARSGVNTIGASDRLSYTGNLNFAGLAAGLPTAADNKFRITVTSDPTNPLVNGESYTLTLASGTGQIRRNGTQVNATAYTFDPNDYQLASPSFPAFSNVSLVANPDGTLVLSFTPVPEPAGLLAACGLATAAGWLVRRRRPPGRRPQLFGPRTRRKRRARTVNRIPIAALQEVVVEDDPGVVFGGAGAAVVMSAVEQDGPTLAGADRVRGDGAGPVGVGLVENDGISIGVVHVVNQHQVRGGQVDVRGERQPYVGRRSSEQVGFDPDEPRRPDTSKQPAVVGCHVWAAAGGGRRRTPLRPPPGGRPGW